MKMIIESPDFRGLILDHFDMDIMNLLDGYYQYYKEVEKDG